MIQLKELLNILSSRYIIVFVGEWGAGKTLSAISYANMQAGYTNIQKIISNVPVYYPNLNIDYQALTQTSQFENLKEDTIIIHDELLNDLDNRMSMSPANRYLTNFAKGFRKLKIQEVATVQYLNQIDVRFDDLLQIIIFPSFKKRYHKKVSEDIKIRLEKKDFRVKWHIVDKKDEKEYSIVLNLYNFINCYETNYIPSRLAVNHQDYLDWFGLAKSGTKLKMHSEINERLIKLSKCEWEDGFKRLKGENLV